MVHQIRNSLKYVSYKDRKYVVISLQEIYQANDQEQAQKALARLDEQWSKKYPYIIKSWLDNWDKLSQMFEFPDAIRKMMYTTNIIENFNSQLRKVTKTKRVFTNDQALMKLLYLVQCKALVKNKPIAGWKQIMAHNLLLSLNKNGISTNFPLLTQFIEQTLNRLLNRPSSGSNMRMSKSDKAS
ncbi:MAG: transposase [Paludibacter sp.]|nr:transposase [Paludibacter sp.]